MPMRDAIVMPGTMCPVNTVGRPGILYVANVWRCYFATIWQADCDWVVCSAEVFDRHAFHYKY